MVVNNKTKKQEARISDDYNLETKRHTIYLELDNGESVEFQMTELDILGMLKTFASILYHSKVAEEEEV
jgi:hypothetical protein